MSTDPFAWTGLVAVSVAPNQIVSVNARSPDPLWVASLPAHASGKIELVVLDAGGAELARLDGFPEGLPTAAFDLQTLDPNASVRVELRSDDVCVLPPVQIGIAALRGHAATPDLPTEMAFAPDASIRMPA